MLATDNIHHNLSLNRGDCALKSSKDDMPSVDIPVVVY